MLLRGLVVVSLMVSGLLAPPANAVAPPPTRTTPAASVAAFAQAAVAPSAIQAASRKPRATLTASYVLSASGKVRVSVASNSKKVKLTYRTAKNKKRTATIKIRKGVGARTLPKGSKRIFAKALATSKLRASSKIPVLPFAPPPPDITPPPVPGGLSAVAGDRQVRVSWTAVPAADLKEYVVVSGATGSGTWTPVPGAPTTATSLTLTGLANDTTVWFTVAARDTSGNTSAYAPAVSATPTAPPTPDTTPPGPVTGLTVTATTTESISLSWTNPTDADFAEVIVRRATGTTPPASPTAGTAVALTGPKETSVTDTGLASATQYAYAVFTRDTAGNTSPAEPTSGTTAATPDTTPPGPVTGLTVTATTTNSISLSWANPVDADLAEVIVRRATGATPPVAPTEGAGIALATATATAVTDSGLERDTAYSYAVFTRDTVGNTSGAVGISAQTAETSPPTPVQSSVTAQIGSRVAVPLADITQLTNLTVDSSPAGVTWDASGGALSMNVAMSAPLGSATATLAATGCVNADCDHRLAITVAVDVTGMQAPAGVPLDDYVGPSPDRIAAAKNLASGLAVLVDEATIVLAEPGTRQTADDIAEGVGAVVAGGDSQLGIYQLRWPTGQDVEARLDALVADPRVASAEGGLLMDKAPAAAAYDDEEAYGPAGSTQFRNNTWHLDLINAPQAWATGATGAGVSIGILEVGHVLKHRDLPEPNGKGNVGSAKHDQNLHATHVAGLACAQDNGIGVIGVAHGCTLHSRSVASTVTLQEDLDVLKDLIRSGARVINNSWDHRPDPLCWPVEVDEDGTHLEACRQSNIDQAESALNVYVKGVTSAFTTTLKGLGRDVILVNAAGNWGMPAVTNPWSYLQSRFPVGNLLDVASVDNDGDLSFFSDFGDDVEIAAPGGFGPEPDGEALLSTWINEMVLVGDQSTYERKEGTSMAAPMVSGVAALVLQKHPHWTGRQVAACLTSSASRFVERRNDNTPADGYDGHQFPYTGRIPIVDAAKALDCASSYIDPPTDQAGGEYIARDPGTGRSVLVADGMVKNIADGGTFLCLAKTRLVWDIPNLKALAEAPTGTATCDNTGRTEWTYTPTAQGGNTGTNVILRNPDRQNWLVHTDGVLQPITSGGTYLCLASRHPVIWNTPQGKIDAWSPASTTPAVCSAEPLPVIDPTPFSHELADSTGGWAVVAGAGNGWWLLADRVEDTLWRYQWIGPDGRGGNSWMSHFDPMSAAATPDGRVFMVGHDRRGTDQPALFEVGADGFGRSIPAQVNGSDPWSSNVTLGMDGNLYWQSQEQNEWGGWEWWLRRIDPATFTVTARKGSPSGGFLQGTHSGLIVSNLGSYWTIPYAAFSNSDRWEASPAVFTLNGTDLQPSVGLDGSLALVNSWPKDCAATQVEYIPVTGERWVRHLDDLRSQPTDPCEFTDVDALPSGGVLITMHTGKGIEHLRITSTGDRESQTVVLGTRDEVSLNDVSTAVTDDGLAVTAAGELEACPPGSPWRTCGSVQARIVNGPVVEDSQGWGSHTVRNRLMSRSSEIFVGQGQVGILTADECIEDCPTSRWPIWFRTMPADVQTTHKPAAIMLNGWGGQGIW